jgi:hypothetical protein
VSGATAFAAPAPADFGAANVRVKLLEELEGDVLSLQPPRPTARMTNTRQEQVTRMRFMLKYSPWCRYIPPGTLRKKRARRERLHDGEV